MKITFATRSEAPKLTYRLLDTLMQQGVTSVGFYGTDLPLGHVDGSGIRVGDHLTVFMSATRDIVRFKPGPALLDSWNISASNVVKAFTNCEFYSRRWGDRQRKHLYKQGSVPLHENMMIRGPAKQGQHFMHTIVEPGEFRFDMERVDRKAMRENYERWAILKNWIIHVLLYSGKPDTQYTDQKQARRGLAVVCLEVVTGDMAFDDNIELIHTRLMRYWAARLFRKRKDVPHGELAKEIIETVWRDVRKDAAKAAGAMYDSTKLLRITGTDHAEIMT